jgi:hypothetical protein
VVKTHGLNKRNGGIHKGICMDRIDCRPILVSQQRCRNSVKSSQSFPVEDVDSYHNLLAMRIELKLRKL